MQRAAAVREAAGGECDVVVDFHGRMSTAMSRRLRRLLDRIAALAECHDVALAPHSPLGPIALAASLPLAFAVPNFLIREQSLGIHYNGGSELLGYVLDTGLFRFDGGYAVAPGALGLGVRASTRPRYGGRRRPGTDGGTRCVPRRIVHRMMNR